MSIGENRKFEIKRYISDMGDYFNRMLSDFIEDHDFNNGRTYTKTDIEVIFCINILIPLLEEKPEDETKNEILELQEFIKALRNDFVKNNGYDDLDKKKIDVCFSRDVLISLFELDADATITLYEFDDDGNQIYPTIKKFNNNKLTDYIEDQGYDDGELNNNDGESFAKMNITHDINKDEFLAMMKEEKDEYLAMMKEEIKNNNKKIMKLIKLIKKMVK